MGVDDDGAGGAGGLDLAVDDRGRALGFEQAGGDAALFEDRLDGGGVAADVRGVFGQVGDRQEAEEFGDDGVLVLLAPLAGGEGGGVGLGGGQTGDQ